MMLNSQPSANRWLIVLAVMLSAFIEVLDMTIVNVAMPQMMGSLQANSDQITWVLTSYIVSSAIVMLLTGFLVQRFGRKRLLLINIGGFLLASACCGIAANLTQMVFFRTLQGVFGASMIPLSQFILRDTFSMQEQGMAMAIWGTGIMVAPVLGPTVGGYITEHLNWRWIFYLNIPVCLVSFLLSMRVISETATKKINIDWTGLLLMVFGVGSLQFFLDRGNTEGWFESNQIKITFIIGLISLTAFIVRGIFYRENIVNLRIFRDRNFSAATFMFMVFGIGIFGTIALQPLMLENLLHYPVITTGELMAPRGVATAVVMFIVGNLLSKNYDARKFIVGGILISAYGAYLMSRFNLDVSYRSMLLPIILQGIGMGLFFVPLAAIAMNTIPEAEVAEATGLFSFGRNLGSSIGISILSTVLSRQTQVNWNTLGGNLQATNPALITWLQKVHMTLQDPHAIQQLALMVGEQAQMIAFNNAYWLVALSFLFTLPLVLLLKGGKLRMDAGLH